MTPIVLGPSLEHERLGRDGCRLQSREKVGEEQDVHTDHFLGIRPEGASRLGWRLDVAVKEDVVCLHAFLFQDSSDLVGVLQEVESDMLDVAGEPAGDEGWSARKAVYFAPALGGLGEDL